MKKLPHSYKYPLIMALAMPLMLLGMTAIMTLKTLPQGANFLSAWQGTMVQVIPNALILIAIVAPSVRLFVSKVLVEPAPKLIE